MVRGAAVCLSEVIAAIEGKSCLPFLGAGASATFSHNGTEFPGVPLGGNIAQILATSCNYTNGASYDLAQVAEHFVFVAGGFRRALYAAIQNQIGGVRQPRPIHTVLAQLAPMLRFFITTNYDQLLEAELIRYGRTYQRHIHNSGNPRTGHLDLNLTGSDANVVLHKMHGTIDDPDSIVITRSDYIRYLANLHDTDRGMPEVLRKHVIPHRTMLFLGYSLADWNFGVIWEGVLRNYHDRNIRPRSFAVVRAPTQQQISYWNERSITLLDMDITEFAIGLAKHFNLEIPVLNIAANLTSTGGSTQ